MIEVELRTFIDQNKYNELLTYFKQNDTEIITQKQITYYFKGDQDFRLMLTNDFCQLWLKKGEIHDDAREELVVKVDNQYKNDLIGMLKLLGFDSEIKWFRVRNSFIWNNINVTLDYTHGYGYILELENLVQDESQIQYGKEILNKGFEELKIIVSDKQLFKEKYEDYKINWEKYTSEIDEILFLK